MHAEDCQVSLAEYLSERDESFLLLALPTFYHRDSSKFAGLD